LIFKLINFKGKLEEKLVPKVKISKVSLIRLLRNLAFKIALSNRTFVEIKKQYFVACFKSVNLFVVQFTKEFCTLTFEA